MTTTVGTFFAARKLMKAFQTTTDTPSETAPVRGSLAREIAAKEAKRVPNAVVRTIRNSKKVNLALLTGALACTYTHQASTLTGLDGFSAGIAGHNVNLGYIGPLVWDVAMIANAGILQTPAVHRTAKRRALAMMLIDGAVSMAVNLQVTDYLPGTWAARILFAVLVALAIGQKWVGAAIRVDYDALAEYEVEVAAQAVPTGRKLTQEQIAARTAKANTTKAAKRAVQSAEAAQAAHAAQEAKERRRQRDEGRRLARQIAEIENAANGETADTVAPVSPPVNTIGYL